MIGLRSFPLLVAGVSIALVFDPATSCHTATAREPANKPARSMLVINEDNSHFFFTRKPEEMTLAGLHAWVDQYAHSAVTHLFLCPNAMRASFRSRTRQAIWDPVDGAEPKNIWPQNAKRLFQAGLDPYKVWIDRCRQQGISPWLSMRMNDVHAVNDPKNFMHSSFWREHPEFWRVPHDTSGSWTNRALDYSHRQVREYQLAFVGELLERYDTDGLELDWMRFGYHLTPGREREQAAVLTEFVREVRSLTRQWAAKRGHRIELGVRVPTHPDAAAGLGMDAIGWARQGLVDRIVPSPFWTSSDFDIPVELWHQRLGPAADRVSVVPALEYNSRPWPGAAAVANDLACARGFATSAYHRGAEGIYLFNWMDSQTRPVAASEYETLLHEGLSPQVVTSAFRRHPVCYRDTVPSGFPNGIQLPVDAQAGGTFRIHIGPKPAAGKAWAIAGMAGQGDLAGVQLQATLNGHVLDTAENVENTARFGGGTTRAVRFSCPIHTLQEGYNQLGLRQVAGPAGQKIVWVEIQIAGQQ